MSLRYFFIASLCLSLAACKKWDDHVQVNNPDLNTNLFQAISANASLSKFKEYIVKARLDTLLQSSKTYTVWAPDNDALATLDPAVAGDTAKLRQFLMNHISNQSYFTRDAVNGLRIAMLNGKYNNFTAAKFDDAGLKSKDRFVSNGVLHVIDKPVYVLPSIWDFINSTTAQYTQNAYIAGLNFNGFDPNLAVVDSISSTTGLPIYHPGTGIVARNRFNERVYDTKREDRQYTYFLIGNTGFALESDSLKNYFKTGVPATNDSLAKFNTVKDLIVEGAYPVTALTNLTSRSGVPIPILPGSIVETKKLSNGIVYILNNVDVLTANKFKEIIIEGENPSGFLIDKPSNTNYRIRLNPVTNKNFSDLLVSGHGVTSFYSYYRLNDVPSIKYKVYGSAINDFQTGALTQSVVAKSLSGSTYTTLATLAYAVPLSSAAGAYNEVLLGEFTMTSFGTLELQLTASGTSPIVLDYLRLVPVP